MFWKNKNPYQQDADKEDIDAYYSILIHFTANQSYIYLLKNGMVRFSEGGVISFTDTDGIDVEITGNCIGKNDFESLRAAEAFIQRFQLDNPLLIEIKQPF
ncbi:hypothetical protein [Bacillus sp. FSL K6-3431]|uniref:hypothetical protein n=1 Tax=Bacillus sp. FSL K6-3431 TaxID=2921500 RepID=UPI0030F6807F